MRRSVAYAWETSELRLVLTTITAGTLIQLLGSPLGTITIVNHYLAGTLASNLSDLLRWALLVCVALPIVCGNVRQTPFTRIWHDSRDMQKIRAVRVRDLPTCSSCTASAFCTRCPGQALVEDGDLYGPSSAACEHALAGAELAGSGAVPASMSRARTSA